MKRWQLMDDENSNIIEVQNGVRKLYLGDFFFGQRTVSAMFCVERLEQSGIGHLVFIGGVS